MTDGTQMPNYLKFEYIKKDPLFAHAIITVPKQFVSEIYDQAARSQQKNVNVPGFGRGNVPLTYIKKNFQADLLENIQEFLYSFCVLGFLYDNLKENKIIVGGEPRLTKIVITPDTAAQFIFELSLFKPPPLSEWKYLPFKAPVRKRYKDLDRQVDNFVKEEREKAKQYESTIVEPRDRVKFNLSLYDHDGNPLLSNYSEAFWFYVSDEEGDNSLREVLLGKKIGGSFCTDSKGLQDFFGGELGSDYNFCIEILDILPHHYFCFDQFKRQFRLRTNKEMLQKLIEVFSYRNDISQRRAMIQEAFALLFTRHRFDILRHHVLRWQERLLNKLQNTPDYNVYRAQDDFDDYIEDLAEKQLKELIFIDQLSYHENVSLSDNDIRAYLNFIKRPRMKEFLYFDIPITKRSGQEIPLSDRELRRTCLREKSLNLLLYHLTR